MFLIQDIICTTRFLVFYSYATMMLQRSIPSCLLCNSMYCCTGSNTPKFEHCLADLTSLLSVDNNLTKVLNLDVM